MMKRLSLLLSFKIILLSIVAAQPEINCDTVHTDPAISEYALPYAAGKTYKVTQSNCFPNGGHNLTFAYDFNTQIGDTIVACRAGFVTFINDQYEDSDWTSGHENNVFIGHADGTRIRYTHLKQGGVLVSVNQLIEQGQAIGISGNSGNTGGFPHLHLSAFKDNTSFNRQNTIPLNFCNTDDPVNDQNLLIQGQNYTALNKTTTTVAEENISKAVRVFPNPVSEMLTVEFSASSNHVMSLQLKNITGQVLYIQKESRGMETVKIPLASFPEGLYFLFVKNGKDTIVKKIFHLAN